MAWHNSGKTTSGNSSATPPPVIAAPDLAERVRERRAASDARTFVLKCVVEIAKEKNWTPSQVGELCLNLYNFLTLETYEPSKTRETDAKSDGQKALPLP